VPHERLTALRRFAAPAFGTPTRCSWPETTRIRSAHPERAQPSDVDWWPARATNAPMLDGCLAWFDHTQQGMALAGGHAVRLIWVCTTTERTPLVRFARSYCQLDPVIHERA
jgi:hypothetical protein